MAESRPDLGRVSIIVPVYNEGERIVAFLNGLTDAVQSAHETLLVYDFDEDSTIGPALAFQSHYPELRLVRNTHGNGVLNALKTGLETATGEAIVVTMADLSDDATQIDTLAARVLEGADVVAASRYVAGGKQIGGPRLKRLLSRTAGVSLHHLTGVGTTDPTNNFKAYSRQLIDSVQVESTRGFELALELTTKAHLGGFEIDEIPTTWKDRIGGESRFDLVGWIPSYLRWYLHCLVGTWTGVRRRALASRLN